MCENKFIKTHRTYCPETLLYQRFVIIYNTSVSLSASLFAYDSRYWIVIKFHINHQWKQCIRYNKYKLIKWLIKSILFLWLCLKETGSLTRVDDKLATLICILSMRYLVIATMTELLRNTVVSVKYFIVVHKLW